MSLARPVPPTGGHGGASPHNETAQRRRPRDRKHQILCAARDLFVARGFPNVSMALIAEQVGITAGALYRHFENKAVLLEQVFEQSFEWLHTPVTQHDYDSTVDEVIALVSGRPYLSDLWTQEMRYLPEEMRRGLRARMRAWNQSLVPGLRSRRPDLDDGQVELLLWSVQSMIANVGRQGLRSPPAERVPAVRDALRALTSATMVPTGPVAGRPPRARLPASMRERLLIAAFEQFTERGFHGASMARIGAAVDVTGPSIYSYFESKDDLLRAASERGVHALWLALERALAGASDPETALGNLARSYVGMARYWASNAPQRTLDPEYARALRAFEREYLAEWAALVLQARPELGARQAYLRVRLGLYLIADLYSNERLTHHRTFTQNAAALLLAVLLTRV
ncbi:TetR/AcrR family transcriptional regulator [Actinomadura madurae]|uniref:TetR/AcrR family transcriptional regulator n=1 Tax=Actinomadura madurae TaxID=1993 RepID=UPI0024E26E5D|nr:TetR/AcrR family transcriptional regulator [Actinomadura madurae]